MAEALRFEIRRQVSIGYCIGNALTFNEIRPFLFRYRVSILCPAPEPDRGAQHRVQLFEDEGYENDAGTDFRVILCKIPAQGRDDI